MQGFTELTWLIALPLFVSAIIYLVGRLAARRWGEPSTTTRPAGWHCSD